MTKKNLLSTQAAVVLALTFGAAPGTLAGPTDVSNVPLATSGGRAILPNLLFDLDDSGSMAWDFMPDYVDPTQGFLDASQVCMFDAKKTAKNGLYCHPSDPPYAAGGANALNGIGYDPNFRYKPGVNYNGQPLLNPPSGLPLGPAPIGTTVVPDNEYAKFSGLTSTNVDLSSAIPDITYCNSKSVCKRPGADTTGAVVSGTSFDGPSSAGLTMNAGQFPYRTNPSNSSTAIFGLPEMMSIGSFARNGTTVTVTTVEAHGLTTSDMVYVTGVTGTTSLNVNCVAVTAINQNGGVNFQYSTSTSGTVNATNGSYRKCLPGKWSIATVSGTTTVTVDTSPNDPGLAVNDVISGFPAPATAVGDVSFATGSFQVTNVSATSFSYASSTGKGTPTGFWVRSDLYNQGPAFTNGKPVLPQGAAVAYAIVPVEYCSDVNLTNCVYVAPNQTPPQTPPAGYTFPAYVRFCQTQAQALAPGAIGDASGTPRCRSKYNQNTTFTTYKYARYGVFKRDTITSGVTSYSNRPNRSDCAAAPTCTYDEEMNNYAMWYTYYRTRMQMMKSSVGIAFVPFIGSPSSSPPKPNSIRLGFITMHAEDSSGGDSNSGTINPAGNKYLRIQDFDVTQAQSFYTKFYKISSGNGTPLQEALARAGWIYAGKLGSGLTTGIPAGDDPVIAACQRNYTLLTTDGFWNGTSNSPPLTVNGAQIQNLDSSPRVLLNSTLVDRVNTVTLDGYPVGASSTVFTPSGTTSEQTKCVANNQAIFPNLGGPTACGCGPKEHAVIQQDVTSGTSTTFVGGVQQGSPNAVTQPGVYNNVSGCVEGQWQETVTPMTQDNDAVCQRNGNNAVFQDGTSASCGSCGKNQWVIIRQTKTFSRDIITTDSVQVSTTDTPTGTPSTKLSYSTDGTHFQSTAPTACLTSKPNILLNPNPNAAATGAIATIGSSAGTALTLWTPNPQTVTGGLQVTTFNGQGTAQTVADTALYYYQTPLRGGKDINNDPTGPKFSQNSSLPANSVDLSTSSIPVKAGAKDFVPYQHMVTFGIGLADGYMRFQPDYATAGSGDYFNIQSATPGACFWSGAGACNWPAPAENTSAALDDLWHAAVNGRGSYFQALNADALSTGIQTVLTQVNAQVASASASATSSPNVTQTDNQIFSTTYETNTWSGSVFAQQIDPTSGTVNPTIQWQADGQLVTKANQDKRNISTFDPANGNGNRLQDFRFVSLDSTVGPFFNKLCQATPPQLSQCGNLAGSDLTAANDGTQVVNFLRGDQSNEGGAFRDRQLIDPVTGAVTQTVLGDTVNAKPVFVRNPILGYTDAVAQSYSTFAFNNVNRASRVYVAANDGFLHAFDGNTGDESWAYAPRFIVPSMYLLADAFYSQLHRYFVDGSPETFDVFDTTAGVWKTILIGGAGGGGRGYYALDVTDPVKPQGLWEFCVDPNLCAINDPNLGYAWGNPIVGKRSKDGRWVAVLTSGLNNIPTVPAVPAVPPSTPGVPGIDYGGTTGNGIGYFYVLDAITGQILDKVSTSVGSVALPSGLVKQSAFYGDPVAKTTAFTDATMRFIYGGDQLGNLWRLDLGAPSTGACDAPATGSGPCISHVAQLTDGSSPTRVQPITTRPQLTLVNNSNNSRVIFVGTGRYLGDGLHNGVSDLSDPGITSGISWLQTMYAIKDRNFDYGTTLRGSTAVVKQTLSLSPPSDRNVTKNAVDWNSNDGWMVDFIALSDDPAGGERVNIDPRLVLGTLVVVTNTPAGGGSCSVGGTSRQYNFDYLTGGYIGNTQIPVGLSLGGTIAVGMAIVQLPSSALKDIITGADTSKTTSNVPSNFGTSSLKRFSYRER